MNAANPKQPYEEQAQDWAYERYQSIFVSRNRWLVAALCAAGLAILQAIALICLTPLKTSVPFLIKEEQSGAVTTVQPLTGNASVTYSEAVKKYFLAKYVVARETYDPTDLAANVNAVLLMSDPAEQRRFDQTISASNPKSATATYADRAKRFVRIKSISFLNPTAAQVRFFSTDVRTLGAENGSSWVAIVGFKFGLPPASDAERLINPLGFLVTSYRIDQEVVQ